MTADIRTNTAGDLKPAKGRSTERLHGNRFPDSMAIGRALVAQEEPKPIYQIYFV
jgi:hypothetical protein